MLYRLVCVGWILGREGPDEVPLASPLGRFDEDFSEGSVLGGVVEPGAVFMVEDEWFDGAFLVDESLERLLDVFSVRKLFFEIRLRS